MENPVSERRTRSDTNRSKNRDCINGSELGGLFVDGLSLLETPVRRLARIQPHGSSDRLRVLTTCAAAVYDLALAGFDVVEQGHTTLMPAVIRDIDEWSILLLAAVGDDSISEDLMSDRLRWRKVERVAKAQWPENITALLKDWGIASGLVHHERRLSVTRYWPEGINGARLLLGANLDCRRTLTWLIRLCRCFGNHLWILRNWDGIQNLSQLTDGANTDEAWRDAVDMWRVKFENPSVFTDHLKASLDPSPP